MAGEHPAPGEQSAEQAARETSAERAASTYEALKRHLYDKHTHAFRQKPHRWSATAETLWPFANAWSATCAIAALDPAADRYRQDLEERIEGLLAYARDRGAALEAQAPVSFESQVTPPYGSGGETYYDDNEWVALAALHHNETTGDDRLLRLAERVFAFVTTGWSDDQHWARPGGVRWACPAWSVTRNTCSTAPAIEVAALLHRRTGDRSYLDWAVQAYAWISGSLRRPDGLYPDRIEPDGTIHDELWSYNQGTMIGAGVLLHEATGDDRYLADARTTAEASVGWLNRQEVQVGQGPPLFGIYLRNLLLLDRAEPDAARSAVARTYADRMWEGPDHRHDGLFVRDEMLVNPTAGMVTIYSLLAGSPPHP